MSKLANLIKHQFHNLNQKQKFLLFSNNKLRKNLGINANISNLFSSIADRNLNGVFRTEEQNPIYHSKTHHGKFYKLSPDVANRLFLLGGFDKEQQKMLKVFQETAIMVRKPALEIIDYLNRTDFDNLPYKYVLYGPLGSGKTFTLNHILHYEFINDSEYFLTATDWINFPQEQSVSIHNLKRLDTPLDATIWLQHFKAQNFNLLSELKLTSLNKYTWSQRESTNSGDDLLSIVDHGINRIKHSSDCMAVLLKELRLNAAKKNCQLLVVVDKVNAFYERSRLLLPDKTYLTSDDITIARAFKKFFKKNWKNGALVASVCKKLIVPYRIFPKSSAKKKNPRQRTYKNWGPFDTSHLSDYPKALLTDEGFQDFDPFIPIEVTNYSNKEIESCLAYYQDRQWLQRPAAKTEEGREEIKFLSGYNAYQVYEFCSNL